MNNERYKYIKELGKGGSGCIKLVYDRHLGIKKVLKEVNLCSAEQMDAFSRETKCLKSVKHSGIPVITDQWIDRNTGYFIMDYCEGTTLAEYIQIHRLSVHQILSMLKEIVLIIDFLHNSSPMIIHGDLKPENLIVSSDGIHLLDFGTAYFENGYISNPSLAVTYGYASPELLHSGHYSVESDIFAIGMILFYMITGKDVRSFPNKSIGPEDFPTQHEESLLTILNKSISGYHHTSELLNDIQICQQKYSVRELDKYSHVLETSKNNFLSKVLIRFLSKFQKRLNNTHDSYVRLEHTFLTDGGHILFVFLIGLFLGTFLGIKVPVYGATLSNNSEHLGLTLQTNSGENMLVKKEGIFEDVSFPAIHLSDRKLKYPGKYYIQIIVDFPNGKHLSQNFAYNKIAQ